MNFLRLRRRSTIPMRHLDEDIFFVDSEGVLKKVDPDNTVSEIGGSTLGASIMIPQQTIVGGNDQVNLDDAHWDTSDFLNVDENGLEIPVGLNGIYVWGANLYVSQPASVGAYMNFQVKTNGAPVNLEATLPLVGTGLNSGGGIVSVDSFVEGDAVYVQVNDEGFVDIEVLNGVLFLYKIG